MSTENEGFTLEEWSQTRPEVFDLSDVFKADIMPLIAELTVKCREAGIPIFIAAVHLQTLKQTGFAVTKNYPYAVKVPAALLEMEFISLHDFEGVSAVLSASADRSELTDQLTH